MNKSAFQKFLATGDFTANEDAAPKKDPTLAAHDKRFHPNGYKEGDSCKFREALAKGDNSDASLAAAEKKEAKQKSNIDKYLSMPDDGFAKDVLSLDEKGIKRLESEIKGFLANSIPNADVKVVKDQPEKGQFAIAVAGTSDDKLMTTLSSYPRTGYWSFTDRYEGNNVKLDGDDKPRKYAFLSFKAKEDNEKKPFYKMVDLSKYSVEPGPKDMADDAAGKKIAKEMMDAVADSLGEGKFIPSPNLYMDKEGRLCFIANNNYKGEKDGKDTWAIDGEDEEKVRDAFAEVLASKGCTDIVFDKTYEKGRHDIGGYCKSPFKKLSDFDPEVKAAKQKKIAKLQKLHEDYNKWFETADRGDIHAWLEEEEKWVKDLKDALEGLEIGKDIQWDSDKRNFYALSDKKDKPTFNPDNRFHMAEDDDLWRRRNEGDADAKVLADLVMDYNRENKWGFSVDDLDAYVQAFEDMDNDKFPKGLPEQSDRNEARKEKFASVISSRPELIRLYIIERLTDANYHREVKALSEGRYGDVMRG